MRRSIIFFLVLSVLCLAFLGYKFFVSDVEKIIVFHDSVMRIIIHSCSGEATYAAYLARYQQGKAVNVYSMTQERNALAEAIQGGLKRIKAVKVPEGQTCRQFHEGSMAYMENLLIRIDKHKEVINFISTHNPGEGDELDQPTALLKPLDKRVNQLLNALTRHQEALAKHYGLDLQQIPPTQP